MNQKNNSKNNDFRTVYREHPPVLPLGFRIGKISDGELCVIDLIDHIGNPDSKQCFFSFGVTKKQAKYLVSNLIDFIESKDENE